MLNCLVGNLTFLWPILLLLSDDFACEFAWVSFGVNFKPPQTLKNSLEENLGHGKTWSSGPNVEICVGDGTAKIDRKKIF